MDLSRIVTEIISDFSWKSQNFPTPCILRPRSQGIGYQRWDQKTRMTISSYLFPRWHLFRHVGYLRHQQQVDLWPFDLESGVWVTCDLGYLCANFSLPRTLCSRVRSDVCNRQTDVRCQTKASLNASALWGGGIIIITHIKAPLTGNGIKGDLPAETCGASA